MKNRPLPSRRRRRRPAFIAGALALLVAAFFGAYAAAAHVLLAGPRLRGWINVHPEESKIDWDEATSIWPGRVHVRNLSIRSSDDNVQWIVRLADAQVRYSVLALATRTFRVSRLSVTGVSFQIRNKRMEAEAAGLPAGILPEVAGFTDPPLRDDAAGGDSTKAAGNQDPWTIDVRDLTLAQVRELWVDTYRFQGEGRIDGQFLLSPGHHARIGPATVTLASGDITLGAAAVVRNVTSTITVTIADFDPRETRGDAVWDKVDAKISLGGSDGSPEFANFFLGSASGPRFVGGATKMTIEGNIAAGVATGTAKVEATTSVRHEGSTFRGAIQADVQIPRWQLALGRMDLSGSKLSLRDVVVVSVKKTPGWWGNFVLPSARIDQGFHAKVTAHARDARPLVAWLSISLPPWTRGLLALDDLSVSADIALGDTRTAVRNLDARGGTFHIQGDCERSGRVPRGAFLIQSPPWSVGVSVTGSRTSVKLLGAKMWFGKKRSALKR